MRDPVIETICCMWFFLFGSCIGSFLNVVVYRLPLGKSLVHPPSFCPVCGHFIRWSDNLPVIGWLKLGGKCRNCRSPISIRYPLIEFLVGTLFGIDYVVFYWYASDWNVVPLAGGVFLTAGTATALLGIVLVKIQKKP